MEAVRCRLSKARPTFGSKVAFIMLKKLLAPLSIAALITLIVSVAFLIGPAFICPSVIPHGANICPPLVGIGVLLGVVILFLGSALVLITLILGLVVTAQDRNWSWFALILILNIFGILIYASVTRAP